MLNWAMDGRNTENFKKIHRRKQEKNVVQKWVKLLAS